MKSNFFFANSAVSSIFLTPVSKLISLREELVNKLDMIDVVCVLSSRDPEADSRLYDTLLLTRDLVGYIEQEINRRYLERTGSVPEDDDYKFFRENMDDILYEESILRNLDSAPLEIAMQMPPLGVCICVKVTVENEPAYAEPKRENLKNQKTCTTLRSSRPRKSSLSENDLAGLFGYVNSQLFRLNNARGLDAVMERQWWNAALALITEEVNRRGIQLMYVGIEKGNEGKSAVELLNMEDEDFQVQAYSILDILDFEALKRVEAEIKKVLSSNPPLYRPYMEEVRQQLQKRTVLLN